MSVRAKMIVEAVEPAIKDESGHGGTVRLRPVITGSPENDQFYRYTPSGSLVLSTINQDAFSQFELGKQFYVDLTPAE